MRFLIADDNRFSLELIKSVLEEYGECVCAEDGVKAVEEFEKSLNGGNLFDLICLDIRMPRMDGQEALCRIREIEKKDRADIEHDTVVTMITALDDEMHITEAFLKGNATGYITKPITRDKLIDEMTLYGLLC